MSTPCGRQGFSLRNLAKRRTPHGTRVSLPATQCPANFEDTFWTKEPRATGSTSFRQEYLCEFADNGRQMFNPDLLRAALRDIEPLHL